MILAITHDGTGKITHVAMSQSGSTLAGYLDDPNCLFVEHDELLDPNAWRIDPETKELTRLPDPEPERLTLAQIKAKLQAKLDDDAEAVRLRYITPGSGQALEYRETEEEAQRFAADGIGGGPYPMLDADRQARLDAGDSATLAQVAADVLAKAAFWRTTAATIKRLRRLAKIKIDKATNPQQAYAAAQVNWP